MSYTKAVEDLHALAGELAGPRRKFELDHMRVLMHALNDPQHRFPAVLIAGTNGKGSTAATLSSILAASGYHVGLYTSPHLLRVNERIQVTTGGGTLQPLADSTFAALFNRVRNAAESAVSAGALPQLPSYFEVVTAMAFCAFADTGVDIAVLEVGLGGRLDATNIVEPLLSVITDIALDHTEWLGNTITEIAREKAGILRTNGVLVTLPQHPEANAAIGEVAVALGVTGINAADYLPGHSPRAQGDVGDMQVPAFGTLLHLAPQLQGEHQRRNLALAVAAAETLANHFGFDRITAQTTTAGVAAVRWPGRLEQASVPGGAPVLLDVAHNPAGVWTLRSFLSQTFQAAAALPAPRTLVFSTLADKAIDEMAQILFPLFDEPGDQILLVHVNSPRASTVQRLGALATSAAQGTQASIRLLGSVQQAYDAVRFQSHGSIVVAGSVYLVSEWKAAALAEADRPALEVA